MEYRDSNDYELIYMIRESNEDASIYMYNKYRPVIDKLAFSYYKKYGNLGIDYDDFFQEGMCGLAKAMECYNSDDISLFYTYANVCIKREMGKLLLRSCRYKNLPLNSYISFDTVVSDEGLKMEDVLYSKEDLVEDKVVNSELYNNMMSLKYELDGIHSGVYELRLNGFSNSDIATLLDLTYKDVDNSLRSIKKKLKKIIKKSVSINNYVIQ